jgi:hypothetical protein
MEYLLKTAESSSWKNHEFYTSSVVLGIDIGMEGIGIYLRKGPQTLHARTYLFTLPESAPLENRRLKRSARRARNSRKRRNILLRAWCEKHGLPTSPFITPNHEPFRLRLDAITEGKGLKSAEALVVCLRHLIGHRGYDYHLTEEGTYPWGEGLNFGDILGWARTTACKPEYGKELKALLSESGLGEDKLERLYSAIDGAVAHYTDKPIRKVLEAHFREKKPNLRPPARKNNFPRELVREHLEEICRKNSRFFVQTNLENALSELKEILDYHRKPPGALAEKKTKVCPYAERLGLAPGMKCALNDNLEVRKFKLLQFLAERTFVEKSGARLYASAAAVQAALQRVEEDAKTVAAKQPRKDVRTLRRDFEREAQVVLARKESHNEDYFDQLRDLLKPNITVLKKRASLGAESARHLYATATQNSTNFDPTSVRANLENYYQLRLDNERGYGIYPQVEFLLGPRQSNDKQAVHGLLKRLMAANTLKEQLGGKEHPDYVVVEVIGDIPRDKKEAKELQKDQKARRGFKDKLFEQLEGVGNTSDRKRLLLFDQQNGICPYTGTDLGDALSPQLQVDHMFPRERGGISEMINLVLTHCQTNSKKSDQTPFEFIGREGLAQHLSKMKWNRAKRELFAREESECPQWQNTTRMAQLARQLRDEVAHWLNIKGDATEMARRIGTPTGYMTSVCREAWGVPKKNRNDLRHHLYDAITLSYIPPGKGLNTVEYGGIFYYPSENKAGSIEMRALQKAGPDAEIFARLPSDECLVIKPRRKKPKQSRMDATIYGQDNEGNLRSRKPLLKKAGDNDDSAVPVKDVDDLLAQSGIPLNKRPTRQRIEAWKEQDWKSADEKKPLKLNDGTKIERVPALASKQPQPIAVIAHFNTREKLPIGFKVATESFIRAEFWVTERRDKKDEIVRSQDGRAEMEYHRRLIPHPRGLMNLRRRMMRCTGEPLSWDRALTVDEIVELGIKDHPEVKRLLKARENIIKRRETAASTANVAVGDLISSPPSAFTGKPILPIISLRKIYCGLPPFAKPLRNSSEADISRVAKGDLLFVPLNKEGKRCKPSEEPYRELWYRVTAIKTEGEIAMHLAEFKEVKPPTEKQLREGKRKTLRPEERWLANAFEQRPSTDAEIVFLMQRTRRHDLPPHPALRTPGLTR